MEQTAKKRGIFSEDLPKLPVSDDFYTIFFKHKAKNMGGIHDITYLNTGVHLEQLKDTNHKATFIVFCNNVYLIIKSMSNF